MELPTTVHDTEGNIVAMGTGAFRIFEKKGSAIIWAADGDLGRVLPVSFPVM